MVGGRQTVSGAVEVARLLDVGGRTAVARYCRGKERRRGGWFGWHSGVQYDHCKVCKAKSYCAHFLSQGKPKAGRAHQCPYEASLRLQKQRGE